MIAVSSFREIGKSPEYDRNQFAARQSWLRAFDAIVYFNQPDGNMAGDNIGFIPWEPFPEISVMAEFCSVQRDWCALINADIVVGDKFRQVESDLKQNRALAACSSRYEFEPGQSLDRARVVDQGLDFFAAVPGIWRQVADQIPQRFRIGHCLFDTWLIGFFNKLCRHTGFYDITPARVIFHPRHGDRHPVYDVNAEGVKFHYDTRLAPKQVRLRQTPIPLTI